MRPHLFFKRLLYRQREVDVLKKGKKRMKLLPFLVMKSRVLCSNCCFTNRPIWLGIPGLKFAADSFFVALTKVVLVS